MIEIYSSGRRQGKRDAFFKAITQELLNGKTVTIAGCDEAKKHSYILTFKERFGIDVDAEPCHYQTPMKIIYDPNDFSPEPAVLGIDYGTKKLYGYNFKKRLKSSDG